MKKTITLFLFIVCFTSQQTFSQIEITGSSAYGRIFDLTYDSNIANKIYAVTLGNHILVSEDNGNNWSILYSMNLVSNGIIEQMKLSADGTALTFAVYKGNSTENAIVVYDIATASITKTFTLPNQLDLAYVSSYDFYDNNMDILLVDTNYPVGFDTEGKTFYTSDGGITWDMIYYTNNYDTVFLKKVAISPNDPNKLFLTRGNGSTNIDGGLFVSNDAGQNFTELLPGVVLDPITFHPTDNQTIYVGTGISFGSTTENVYKSTDGGSTFNIVPISWTSGILDNIVAIKINENNPSQILILEENEMVISEDAGVTWQNVVYLNEDPESYYYGLNASYNPQNSSEIVISANYKPLFSNDGGLTVASIPNPYFASTGKTAVFKNASVSSLYYGVQFGNIHRDLLTSTDTAYNIVPLNYFSNGGGAPYFVDQITPNRIFTLNSGFVGSSLTVSNDNGNTQNQLYSLFTNRFTALATYPTNTETVLAAFAGYDPSETILKKVDFSDINNVQATDVSLPVLNYINGILIDNTDKVTVAIGTEVYYTNDDGTTWVNSSAGLETLTANDLIYDLQQDPLNSNNLALATTSGVFISTDSGSTWNQKTTSIVHNVAFSTESQGVILASTYSSEVSLFHMYYSTDGGDNWETISNDLLLNVSASSSSYYFNADSVIAYVGTADLGLMEFTLDINALGLPQIASDQQMLSVFPNPSSNIVNIDVKNANINRITLYSLTGKMIKEFIGASTIDISSFSSGIYLMRVQDSNNKVNFKKIVRE
ncbi:T9SS type A sorting domain-containing protein [Winogradskyella endarachnes]|uniref:T9SS type A sorting domain-containing protein n=1 Tax=Winogradskyella endarachnes TaxID=2681965 RepID=A0A6L6U7P7_9FLAO|nr:T9SS type A sorting domain-containing protein [Winogradskyella endarachnes]MUU78315.1 T9SS type A sorting domain-containing protein [Winogradskyella endarachnes]